MFSKKQILKATGMVTAAMVVSLSLPNGNTHAASLNEKVGSTNSWVSTIFGQVWNQVHGGQTGGNNSENSGNNSGSNGGNTGGTEKPDTGGNTTDANEDQSNVTLADKILKTGEKYLGTPYQFGAASGQTRTFDCSSFTQYVFKQHGISLPRSSRQQSTVGTSIPRSQLKKGDLLFFKISSSNGRVGHVAIYAGDNKVLHTWGKGGVRYESLSTKWLDQGYLHAKRVIK